MNVFLKFRDWVRKWFIPFFALSVIISSLGGPHSLMRIYRFRKRRDQIKEDILYLVEENKLLRQEIRKIRHDPEPICRMAREELGLVKPGEIIYRYYKRELSKNTNKD